MIANKNDPRKCTNDTKLKKFVKQEVYVSLMLPYVILNYDNLNELFQVDYRNHYRSSDLRLSRYKVCEFNQVTLLDDLGSIFKTKFNTTGFSFIECGTTPNYIETAY